MYKVYPQNLYRYIKYKNKSLRGHQKALHLKNWFFRKLYIWRRHLIQKRLDLLKKERKKMNYC